MFKTRPIRRNCPICKAEFQYVAPRVEDVPEKKKKATKGKKKKAGEDKPKEPVDPTVSMLYQMRFDRQKVNIPLI
tara:strand:+ start:272 stop:496 length:225 start_codon:yes stop_codon:yes gene_type:complete